MTQRRHWYFVFVEWCPVCLSESTARERRYTRRPKSWGKRHEWREVWDYCDAF